jgi:hypothetical protein
MDDRTLHELLSRRGPVPYPGQWLSAPFTDRNADGRILAVIAEDPGLSLLGVDRADGTVLLLDDTGSSAFNTDAEALVACSLVYGEAVLEAAGLDLDAPADSLDGDDDDSDDVGGHDETGEDGDEDDEADDSGAATVGDLLTDALIERFRGIDPVAVAEENSFWSIAAEELGYGLTAPDPDDGELLGARGLSDT